MIANPGTGDRTIVSRAVKRRFAINKLPAQDGNQKVWRFVSCWLLTPYRAAANANVGHQIRPVRKDYCIYPEFYAC